MVHISVDCTLTKLLLPSVLLQFFQSSPVLHQPRNYIEIEDISAEQVNILSNRLHLYDNVLLTTLHTPQSAIIVELLNKNILGVGFWRGIRHVSTVRA